MILRILAALGGFAAMFVVVFIAMGAKWPVDGLTQFVVVAFVPCHIIGLAVHVAFLYQESKKYTWEYFQEHYPVSSALFGGMLGFMIPGFVLVAASSDLAIAIAQKLTRRHGICLI